jgi:hypothetical protein
MKTTRYALAAILVCSALTGCEKKDKNKDKGGDTKPTKPDTLPKAPDAPPSKPGDTTAKAPGDAKPSADGFPIVKLLDAGKDPKTVLRFKPTAGSKTTLELTMKMSMEMALGGNSMPSPKLPEMKMAMDMTVKDVTPAGDATYDFTLTSADVADDPAAMPQVVTAMRQALAGAKGMTGTAKVTSRGFTTEGEFKTPDNMDPKAKQLMDGMKQSLKQMSAPLPEEPVGVGAKWEVQYNITQNGMSLTQIAQTELVSLEGNKAKLKLTLSQKADPQKVSAPGMPPGVEMQLTSLKSDGTGESNLDFGKLWPESSKAGLTSEIKMQMEQNGQKQDMTMKMGMDAEAKTK